MWLRVSWGTSRLLGLGRVSRASMIRAARSSLPSPTVPVVFIALDNPTHRGELVEIGWDSVVDDVVELACFADAARALLDRDASCQEVTGGQDASVNLSGQVIRQPGAQLDEGLVERVADVPWIVPGG
jgi:hypothetical protein